MTEIRIYYRRTKGLTSWFLLVGILGIGEQNAKKRRDRKNIPQNSENSSIIETEIISVDSDKKQKGKSNFSKKILSYLRRTQLPFYVLHFPILAFLAFVITPLDIPWLLKISNTKLYCDNYNFLNL